LAKVLKKFQLKQEVHGFRGLKTYWKGVNAQLAGIMVLARTVRLCLENRKKEGI